LRSIYFPKTAYNREQSSVFINFDDGARLFWFHFLCFYFFSVAS